MLDDEVTIFELELAKICVNISKSANYARILEC